MKFDKEFVVQELSDIKNKIDITINGINNNISNESSDEDWLNDIEIMQNLLHDFFESFYEVRNRISDVHFNTIKEKYPNISDLSEEQIALLMEKPMPEFRGIFRRNTFGKDLEIISQDKDKKE